MNNGKKKVNLTSLYSLSEKIASKQTLSKSITTKHEDWSMRFKIIMSEAEIIKTSLQAKDKDLSAIHSSYMELDKKLKTIIKEIQKAQKVFLKKRSDIQSKLILVVDTIEGSNGILLSALRENAKKIHESLEALKKLMDENVKRAGECESLLKPLGDKIAKLLLPKNIETCAADSKDLKDRLEAIIRSASDMNVEEAPPQFNRSLMSSSLTLLREHCASNVKLADLVHSNIKKVFGDIDAKEAKEAKDGKEAKEGVRLVA